MTKNKSRTFKKIFSFVLASILCLGMSVSSMAAGNSYEEAPLEMPAAPATILIPEAHQRVIAEGAGIDIFKEPPEDLVMTRANMATMTSSYDQRMVRLVIKFQNSPYSENYGTGFMIGPDAIATAAHNMNHPQYGRATSITCYIGAGNGITAVEAFTITDTSKFLRPSAWDSTKGYRYDYGVIKLNRDVTSVGYYGFGAYSDSVLSSNTFKIAGYGTNSYPSAANSQLTSIGTYDFYYYVNTRGGDSGGPVSYNNGYVAGIHAYGISEPDYPLPSATRITQSVFDDLREWKYQ